MSEETRRRVLEMYAEVDREVASAGPVCVASGRCCRFREYGHVLFLTNLEADVLLAAAPPYETPVNPDFCPFQKDNLCTAREPRPLGCRVYYCDPNYQETAGQITEKYVARLKQLAEEHGVDYLYAPLHHFLNNPGEERGRVPLQGLRPGRGREAMMPWRRSLVALLFLTVFAQAGDWPQWLGPNRDGSTTEKVEPWKDAPKILWTQAVGEGHSSPVVAGNRVFVHAKVKDKDEEELLAFDAKDGKPLWHTGYARGNFKALFGNGPRATPSVDGDLVYSFGITGILTCFQVSDGKQLWQVDTLKKFEAKNLFFGMSGSPLVDGDRVMVEVGGKGAGIVAFEKMKGDVVWQALDDKASYASAVVFGEGTKRQAVFFTHEGLVSLDPVKGQLLWRYPMVDLLAESSTTPVKAGDLIVASSITLGAAAVKLEGDKIAEKAEWKNPNLNCYFSTPVTVGKDYLYMVTGTKPPAATVKADLRCVETATGKELWTKQNVGKYHASLLRTGNAKLLMLDDGGNLILLEPNAKEYTELARSKVCGADTVAHPAVADGRLYIRDRENLICLQLPQ